MSSTCFPTSAAAEIPRIPGLACREGRLQQVVAHVRSTFTFITHTSALCRCVFFISHVAAVVAAGHVRKYKVAAADSIADLLVMGQTVTQSNFLRVHGISPMTSRPGLRALPQGLFVASEWRVMGGWVFRELYGQPNNGCV